MEEGIIFLSNRFETTLVRRVINGFSNCLNSFMKLAKSVLISGGGFVLSAFELEVAWA